jgi:glycosyltransferase involved in cell wall biosynthesis
MRIALLGSRGYPSTYGGYETMVRRVAPALADRGHEVTVYCRQRPGRQNVWMDGNVRCVWTPGRESKSASTLTFGLSSHIDAAARRFDAALVLNVANGYYLPVLRRAGTPTVLNTDGLEWERGKWGPVARAVFFRGAKLSASAATILVSDSEAIADVWERDFAVRPRFIPYGADVQEDLGSDRVKAIGVEPGRYVLAVARLIPENNVELLLDALDRMPDRAAAVVVGSATYGSPLEERLQHLDGIGAFRWLGHVHDQTLLTQLWANCAVYVHGHSVGGTNPALLQALGAGAPTLALDTPFNREVILNDPQLFPQDAQRLSEVLAAVVADAPLRRSWRERGREIVRTRYRWDDVTRAYEQALRDAIRARAGLAVAPRLPRGSYVPASAD